MFGRDKKTSGGFLAKEESTRCLFVSVFLHLFYEVWFVNSSLCTRILRLLYSQDSFVCRSNVFLCF